MSSDESPTGFPWLRTIIGALLGAVVFYVGGTFLLLALAGDDVDGWVGLVAVATAFVTWAPLGAVVGALFGARRRFGPWWGRRPPLERTLTVVVALAGAVAPVFFTNAAWEAVALGAWGLMGGAVVGHLVGRAIS